jgi:hypothetical protein
VDIKLFLMGAAVAAISGFPAQAHEWFLLNFQNGQCESAANNSLGYDTPYGAYKAIRAMGTTDSVRVVRDPSTGKVFAAMVVIGGENGKHLDYFPSKEACEAGRQKMIDAGLLPPDMKELD